MKRLWIGIIILLLLLAAGIWISATTIEIHKGISHSLEQAAAAAMREDWARAQSFSSDAKQTWQYHRRSTASVTDHEPMEQIDSLFSQMDIYLVAKDPVAFSACCASLSVLTQAIGEAQTINWWSLL